jgi:NTE family protein
MPQILTFTFFFFLFIFSSGCSSPLRYIPKGDPEPLPSFYVPEKIRVALVLGSGGVRGMAHVGVLEELEAEKIPIDLIVGCSAGGLVGVLYADNPHIDEVKDIVWNIPTDSFFDMDIWRCRYGLSQGGFLRKSLDSWLYAQTFEELQIPLIIVATDLYSGELVPMGSGSLRKAVQASCSLPFVYVPCEHMGRILVDGGVINPVPVKVAKDLGADIVIAVDLCELLPKTFATNLFEVAKRSAEIAFMWQNEACTHHADVIIRPKTTGVGTFNDGMKGQIYAAGKQAAREQMPYIKKLLKERANKTCQNDHMRLVHPICYTPQICQENTDK